MAGEDNEGTQGPDIQKIAEDTTVDESVRLEVEILALNAAGTLTATIAEEVAAFEPDIVIVGGENLSTMGRAFTVFRERAESMIGSADSLLAPTESAGKQDAVESSALIGFLKTTTDLFSYFKAEAKYLGRSLQISETALYPLLVRHLRMASIKTLLPELFAPGFKESARANSVFVTIGALIDRRTRLNQRYDGTTPPADIGALLATMDAAIDSAVKPDPQTGNTAMAQLLLGSDICRLAAEAKRPLLVSLKSIAAGGHFRTRKHLFTTIFTGDKISYSGGAAISYFIFDLKTSEILGSGVLSAREIMKGD